MKKSMLICLIITLTAGILLSGCNNSVDTPESHVNTDTTSPIGDDTTTPESSTVADEFEAVLRIAVCSDIHMKSVKTAETDRFTLLLQSAYAYSASQTSHPTLDALIIAGDLTDTAAPEEYDLLNKVISDNMKPETQLLSVWGNNHDTKSAFMKYMNTAIRNDTVINGFHIIGISPASNSGDYSDPDIKWLAGRLELAASEDPRKPIFTFRHHHIKDTVYVSPEWNTKSSDKIDGELSKYPQVIDFSGHSHGPMNNPKSIWQDKYTALGTGTLSYFEMESGMTYGTQPPNKDQAAQYYIVEADSQNRVRILPYNILTNDFFKTPANDDDPNARLEYNIEVPSDPDTFKYNTKQRAENASAPYFAEGTALTVSDIKGKTVTLTIPQAIDSQCIYSYKIVYSDGSVSKELKYFSDYYIEPLAKNLNYTLTGLKPNTDYTVTVTPFNCYDIQGSPIVTTFRTADNAAFETSYTSENKVTYKGTFTDFESLTALKRSADNFAYGGSVGGDVALSEWDTNNDLGYSYAVLEDGKGYKGSRALAISSDKTDNHQSVFVFATAENKNPVSYPGTNYLRIWVDFTDIDFRKVCFGFVDGSGNLFATDFEDGRTDQHFWYMKDGTDKWVEYNHGSDGCFGNAQGTNVKGFKGWMAFPTENFFGRSVAGTAEFSYGKISGIYMYWNCSGHTYEKKKFYLDEIHIVDDYTVFEAY